MATILLVEDYAVHRSAIRYFLQQHGHEVVLAADGAEALELLTDWRPDAILLDLAMPNVDGLGVLAALRDSGRPPVPVIVTTATTEATQLAVARDMGACEILVKSRFSLTALADSVDRVLRPRTANPAIARIPA